MVEKEDPLLGTLVADRYRVTRRIGAGGMGVVYLATHEALRKQVALKILAAGEAGIDREAVARFEREAVTAANVKHPNIAEAIDFGPLPDGGFYLAMEYVAGITLRKLIDEHGALPRARAIAIVEQVGAALAAAHAHDVVHRDLKPDNVIVAEGTDRVKVIDFGIAKLRSSAFGVMTTGITQVRTMIGTPEYMSPEQVIGQAVDARADQYTLGILAFELLAGAPPFRSADLGQLRMMHVGAPVPSLRAQAPGVSPEIEAVISKMLAKLPDERFESVAEAMRALTDALSGASVPPPYVPLKHSLVPPPARSRSQLLTVGIAAVAITGVATALFLASADSNDGATPASSANASSEPSNVANAASTASTASVASAPSATSGATISPELSAALSEWRSGHVDESATVIRKAIAASPELAELDAVTKPLAAPLADEAAARALRDLLDQSALGTSRSMASALADVAVIDDAKPRDAALSLLRSRQTLLPRESLARVRLRDAETCEAFEAAKDAETRAGTIATRRDLERLALAQCTSMVRVRQVCDCSRPDAADASPVDAGLAELPPPEPAGDASSPADEAP